MSRLLLTRRFQKNFERLDAKTQGRVKQALLNIREDPNIGKRLTGDLAGEFSYRIGDYRIIYTIEKDDIFIEIVRHRRDVYKKR